MAKPAHGLTRPSTLQAHAITTLYVSAMKSSGGCFWPFLVDSGFTLKNIRLFGATGSFVAELAGALVGGMFVSASGSATVLLAALGAQAIVLIYCLLAASGTSDIGAVRAVDGPNHIARLHGDRVRDTLCPLHGVVRSGASRCRLHNIPMSRRSD